MNDALPRFIGVLFLSLSPGFGGGAGAAEPVLKEAGDLIAEAKTQISEVEAEVLAEEQATVIIDVREAIDYAAGHVPGAIHVPRGSLEFKIGSLEPLRSLAAPERREQPIVLYCDYGGRGALAARTLQDMGYVNVRSLRGGLLAWKSQGLPIETSATQP